MDLNRQIIYESYIKNLRTGEFLHFTSMPETFSDAKAPNWSSQEIIGRWTPVRGYSSSGPRTISIMLTFHSGVDKADSEGTKVLVLDKVNWLRSLTYPNYSNVAYSPDPVMLRIGRMVFMKSIVTGFDCNWRAPWDLDEEISMIAEVSLTFEECSLIPLDAQQVRSGLSSINYNG